MLNFQILQKNAHIRLCALFVLPFVFGILCAYAMAPYHYIPLLFLGISGYYVCLLRVNTSKQAAFQGFLFGFGFFLFGLEWVGNALLVDGNQFAWVWPLAVCGLPTVLSLFYALAAYISHRFLNLRYVSGFFAFCCVLAFTDWLRGHLFTGFPWNLFAYSWGEVLEILQLLSLGNVYFLNLLSIVWAATPAFIIFCLVSGHSRLIVTLILLSSLCLSAFWGGWRLDAIPTEYHANQYAHIVQPNILQQDKWDTDKVQQHFEKLIRLSRNDDISSVHVSNGSTLIVWPETATSNSLLSKPENRALLKDALSTHGEHSFLLTGLLTHDPDTGYGNSAVLFDSDLHFIEKYNKTKLVPFGEFIPFQDYIPLTPVAQFTGFGPGSGSVINTIPGGLTYRALVCYEIIFPGSIKQKGLHKPDLILNITNDAWYGVSAGPYQHFLHARYRAIESGIPVIRSANTGISTLIDGYGRILYQSILNTEKNYLTPIPKNTKVLSNDYIGQNALFMLVCLFGSFGSICFRIVSSSINRHR